LMVNEVIRTSNKIEQLENQLYHINKIECEIKVIETALESEPQTVVQLCLFILMKRFKRIKLLFTSYVGISIETVFVVSWLMTLFSIANSVYGYLHSKRWPISPAFFGILFQIFAIAFLVLSKPVLIAITLLNAVYLHPFLYIANMFFIFLYPKLFSGEIEIDFHHTMVTGIAPAFYKSSKKASKSTIIRRCSKILQKYGIIINSVILHLIPLMIYSAMGAILRITTFQYNIKETYEDIDNHTNNTAKSNGIETNEDIPSNLEYILFYQPLHNFPIYFVVGYIICIGMYVVFTAIYYRAFHPWKNIIWDTKYNEHIQESEMESNSHQDDDESSTGEEISHL